MMLPNHSLQRQNTAPMQNLPIHSMVKSHLLSSSSWRLWRIAIIQLLGISWNPWGCCGFGDVKLPVIRGVKVAGGWWVRGVKPLGVSIQGGDRFLEWNFNLGFFQKIEQVFSPTNQTIQTDNRQIKKQHSPEKNVAESNKQASLCWRIFQPLTTRSDPFRLSIWMTLWKFFIWPRDGCWMWGSAYCFPWCLGVRLVLWFYGMKRFLFPGLFRPYISSGQVFHIVSWNGESFVGFLTECIFSILSQIYYIIWQMPHCSMGLEYLFVPWATWKKHK